jgi:multidrug efflux pump subunit AcrA (membrane-fusion protein)
MKAFPFFVRYGSILLAVVGVWQMTQVLQVIRAQENPIPPPPVAPPEKPFAKGVAATGILEAADENVSIGTPIPGLVSKVMVKVWDKVKTGQELMQLDDRELQAQLIGQEASIVVNQANLDIALAQLAKVQDMLDRLKSITDQRAISQDDLRNRTNDVIVSKAQAAQAKAQLEAAHAAVKQTKLLIERLTVRAPRAGSILQVNIRAGEYASAQNRQVAITLGDVDMLQVRADVDEQNAMTVRADQPAKAFLKGDSHTAYDLEFVRIDPFVIPKQSLTGASTERVDTRVLQVIYRLKVPAGKTLYVGQQVDVFIGEKN